MPSNFNPITLFIIISVVMPLIFGLVRGITARTIIGSALSILEMICMIGYIIISITLIRKAFFEQSSSIYKFLAPLISDDVRQSFVGREMFAYAILTPLLLFLLTTVGNYILGHIYTKFVGRMHKKIGEKITEMSLGATHLIGMLWELPRAVVIAFVLGFVLNFFSYMMPNGKLVNMLNHSEVYSMLYEYSVKPVLQSSAAKDIPLILNNAFAFDSTFPNPVHQIGYDAPVNTPESTDANIKNAKNVRVIEYFNGVTLDEAVKSNSQIDSFARDITANKKTSYDKAFVIYNWIRKNIEYDQEKAKNISNDSKVYTSGAIEAFNTRTGICFDYSCLFIAMCRAADIKCSLVTGVAYNGMSWGDHAWNQFYSAEEKRWVEVDTTFGAVSNYFDKKGFEADHKYANVRQTW